MGAYISREKGEKGENHELSNPDVLVHSREKYEAWKISGFDAFNNIITFNKKQGRVCASMYKSFKYSTRKTFLVVEIGDSYYWTSNDILILRLKVLK